MNGKIAKIIRRGVDRNMDTTIRTVQSIAKEQIKAMMSAPVKERIIMAWHILIGR
jgi:hypothetical protein